MSDGLRTKLRALAPAFPVLVALALFWLAVACAILGDWRACVGCAAGVCGCVLLAELGEEPAGVSVSDVDLADAA